jgi:hypothetical protein
VSRVSGWPGRWRIQRVTSDPVAPQKGPPLALVGKFDLAVFAELHARIRGWQPRAVLDSNPADPNSDDRLTIGVGSEAHTAVRCVLGSQSVDPPALEQRVLPAHDVNDGDLLVPSRARRKQWRQTPT